MIDVAKIQEQARDEFGQRWGDPVVEIVFNELEAADGNPGDERTWRAIVTGIVEQLETAGYLHPLHRKVWWAEEGFGV